MDFISDALATGRRIKVLTIVDDFTKESVDLVAEHGISGHYVVRVLGRAAQFWGMPSAIRTDQGPRAVFKLVKGIAAVGEPASGIAVADFPDGLRQCQIQRLAGPGFHAA